jgi:hypothetical protein
VLLVEGSGSFECPFTMILVISYNGDIVGMYSMDNKSTSRRLQSKVIAWSGAKG